MLVPNKMLLLLSLLMLPMSLLAQDKSGSRSGLIRTPAPGGSVVSEAASFTLSSNRGDNQYNLPLPELPTRSGYGPGVALTYSQYSGDDGLGFGIGWAITVPSVKVSMDLGIPIPGKLGTGDFRSEYNYQGKKLVFVRNVGSRIEYRLKASEGDVKIYYHPSLYTVEFAKPVNQEEASISSGFEFIFPDGSRQLFSSDLSIAEGEAEKLIRLPLVYEIAPHGETISYKYTKSGGRSYLTDIYFAGGASHYEFVMDDTLSQIVRFQNGLKQEHAKVYSKIIATYKESVHRQWCLVYRGRSPQDDRLFEVKTHSTCQAFANEDLDDQVNSNSLSILEQLVAIYRFGSDTELSETSLQLPKMSFSYSDWTIDSLNQRSLVHFVPGLENDVGFDNASYELADINHDGLTDVLHRRSNGNSELYQAKGALEQSFYPAQPWIVQRGDRRISPDLSSENFHFADINGDSYIDVLEFSGTELFPYLGNGSGELQWTGDSLRIDGGTLGASNFSFGKARFIDMNFDGKSDVLTTTRAVDGTQKWRVYLNLSRQQDDGRWSIRFVPKDFGFFSDSSSLNLSDPNFRIADVNGDGLPDLSYYRPSSIANQSGVCVYINHGRLYEIGPDELLFGEEEIDSLQCGRGGRFIALNGMPATNSLNSLWAIDVNGDGIQDYASVGSRVDTLLVWLGFGNFRVSAQAIEISLNQSFNLADRQNSRSRIADIDGDGQQEILYFDSQAEPGQRVRMIDFNRSSDQQLVKSNLLTNVRFSSGLQHSIRYATSTSERLRDQRLGKPVTKLHFPVVVTKQVVTVHAIPGSDKQSTKVQEFFYHEPIYDSEDKKFLGFTEIETLSYGDKYVEDSSLKVDRYLTRFTEVVDRELAGLMESSKIYTLQDSSDELLDDYFKEQTELSKSLRFDDPRVHSLINESANQTLPLTDQLVDVNDWNWELVDRRDGSYFVRLLGERSLVYGTDEVASLAPRQTVITYDEYDNYNISHKRTETYASIYTPFGVQIPENVVVTEYGFDTSRRELSERGIIDKPDFVTVTQNGELKSYEAYQYNESGQMVQKSSYGYSRIDQVPSSLSSDYQSESEYILGYRYDEYGNRIELFDNFGSAEKVVYDEEGVFPRYRILPKAEGSSKDLIWNFDYESGIPGVLASIRNPLGVRTSFEYDNLLRRTRTVSDTGVEQAFFYKFARAQTPMYILTKTRRYADDQALPAGEYRWIAKLSAYLPDGTPFANLEDVSPDLKGNPSGIRVTEYNEFDRNNRKLTTYTPYTIRAPGMNVEHVFSSNELIPKLADEPQTSFRYDFAGRLKSVLDPAGKRDVYSYYPWGGKLRSHYLSGSEAVVYERIDISNHIGIHAVIERNGGQPADEIRAYFTYDALGHLSTSQIDGEGQARQFVFDSRGRLEYQKIAGLGSYYFVYDQRDRQIAKLHLSTEGDKQRLIQNQYDLHDRLRSRSLDGQLHTEMFYDSYSTAISKPMGAYKAGIDQPVGLLVSQKVHDHNHRFDYQITAAYDRNGRVVANRVNLGGKTYTDSFDYSLEGVQNRITNAYGLEGRFRLDASGYLRSADIRLPGQHNYESVLEGLNYNAKGQLDQILYRQVGASYAQTDLGYNQATLQLEHIDSFFLDHMRKQPLQNMDIELNGNQSVLQITDHLEESPFGLVNRTASYRYDWRDQLIEATRFGKTLKYDYDSLGNFIGNGELAEGITLANGKDPKYPRGVQTTDYSFNQHGELSSSPRITSTRFNALGQLVYSETADKKVYYGYDASGYRIYKQVEDKASGRLDLSLFPSRNLSIEPSGEQSFMFVGDSRLMRLDHANGEWYYYLKDHLGSSDIMMHSSGKPVEQMLYFAYGTEADPKSLSDDWDRYVTSLAAIAPLERTHHRFTGHYLDDDTGIYYMNARYYDPKLGRFISPDPAFVQDPMRCMSSIIECNLYSYGANNPIKFIDLTGLIKLKFYMRSFAPFKSFGGGFHGDNRGFSTDTSTSTTSRIKTDFKFDTDTGRVSQIGSKSDPSMNSFFDAVVFNPAGNTAFAGSPSASVNSSDKGAGRWEVIAKHAGSNPMVPGAPDIDVTTAFHIKDMGDNRLSIHYCMFGDAFPNAETFVEDQAGNRVMINTFETTKGPLEGPFLHLAGDNKRMMGVGTITIKTDDQDNFVSVIDGRGQEVSIDDWNKRMDATGPGQISSRAPANQ